MPVETIHLKNFQAHGDRKLVLSPRINVITGPTDAGKSAVLRALRWACLNDFSGDDFVKEGEKTATVTVIVDGKDIIRCKGGNTNTYELDRQPFKSFQTSVPQDIADVLQISDINFQSQHDSPFWFNETAGEVSRRLNAIIDLSVIDTTLATIAADVRKAQDRGELVSDRLAAAEKSLEELQPQCQRAHEFKQLDEADEKLYAADQAVGSLELLLKTIRGNRAGLLRQRADEGAAVLASAGRLRDVSRTCDSLAGLLDDLADARSQAVVPPVFDPVLGKFAAWQSAGDQASGLNELLEDIADAAARVRKAGDSLKLMEYAFHRQTKGIACPVCEKKM